MKPMTFIGTLMLGATTLHAAPPAAPGGTKVAPLGTTRQIVTWTDLSADETGFTIERFNGAVWQNAATVAANTSRHILSGQPAGTQIYRVLATNGDGASSPSPQATTLRMNVLFFLADDMGYKDIVANRNPATDGPTIYETPALDTLVSQGVSFTNAYCSGPKCVVARRSIQTGMYDFRVAAIAKNGGIPVEMVTIGEAMKSAGYRTCFIGKWHLGGHLDGSTGGDENDAGGSFTPGSPLPYTDWSLLATTDNKYIPETDPNHYEGNKTPAAQGYDEAIATGEWGAPPIATATTFNPQTGGYYPTLIPASSPTRYWYGLPDTIEAPDNTNPLNPVPPPAPPILETSASTEYLTDRLTTRATGFIGSHISGANQGMPFFLTLAHYAVHTPLQADPVRVAEFQTKRAAMATQFATHPGGAQFIRDYSSDVRQHQDQPIYAAMMDSFDDSLAAIRTYLESTPDPRNPGMNLAATTIIVLSSDHGGKSTHIAGQADLDGIPTSNYPLRQGKTWCYEGGLKIPMIVYWPGITQANAESEALVNAADIYTSILDMTGSPHVPSQHLDSISFAESSVTPSFKARDESHHWFTNADSGTGNPALAAYRFGNYKLVYHIIRRDWELYDLATDPGEQNDIASIRPDVVNEYFSRLVERVSGVGARRPVPGSNSWNEELLVEAAAGMNIPAEVPNGAPSQLAGTAVSDTAIDIHWTDNSTDEERFVIQRKPTGSGAFLEIATVPANVTRFRDTGLTPSSGYQYRIYAENLKGWNPVAPTVPTPVTVTTNSTAALPIIARGDDMTTLKNETRDFLPLANDQGKNLTLTTITQPALGTAVIQGSMIHFVPSLDATGEDWMTYIATDANGSTATGTVRITILADHDVSPPLTYDLSPVGSDVDVWDFNDANGTTVAAAAKTTGASVFTGATPTVQNGSLRFAVGTTTASIFRNATIASGALPLGSPTSGVREMSFRINGADLSGGANNSASPAYIGIGTRGKDIANANSDPLQIRLQENGGNLDLQCRGASTSVCRSFTGLTLTEPLEVRVVMDLVNKTGTVYSKLGSGVELSHGPYAFTAATVLWDIYRLSSLNNTTDWGAADYVNVDYLRFRTLTYPEPPTDFQLWMDTAQGSITPSSEKSPLADADDDGINNILEYAYGGHPYDSALGIQQHSVFGGTEGGGFILTLPVIPSTNFAPVSGILIGTANGVISRVLGSLDLNNFNSPVEEVYPALETGLQPAPRGWEYRSFRLLQSETAPRGFIRASAESAE